MAGATRGSFLGDVRFEAFHVITGIAEDEAADFVASKVVETVDSQVNQGVYKLKPDKLDPLKEFEPSPIAGGEVVSLVLIHGTFSSTSGTFGKLWSEHPQLVAQLFKRFPDRVYALDHPTLGASPIANAITLAKAAPERRAPPPLDPLARRAGCRSAGTRMRQAAIWQISTNSSRTTRQVPRS